MSAEHDLFSAPAAIETKQAAIEHVPSDGRRNRQPIAEHNAEMDAHMASFFPPDPGKIVRLFRRADVREGEQMTRAWVALAGPLEQGMRPRAGWLNYHGKQECIIGTPGADGLRQDTILGRYDMTEEQFNALPVVGEERKLS